MSKKHSKYQVFLVYLLIIQLWNITFSQLKPVVIEESALEDMVTINADDSIMMDAKGKKVYLFGNAVLVHPEAKITANYMEMDFEKKEVYATYTLDKDGNRVGIPNFEGNGEQFTCASIRYNFETKKAYIEEVRIKQDEIYLFMGESKRQSNSEIHFKNGRFTTCDQLEPHYHFQLSKAVLVPEKRVVSGPLSLYVQGVPTPIGLPFAIIPQQKTRKHGILFPRISPISDYGFGFQELGYHIPINDKIQTNIFLDLFSRGTFGIGNKTEYFNRYGPTGNLELGYQRFRQNYPNQKKSNQKITLIWNHRSNPKSNPYWSFGSQVNFISDNNAKISTDVINENYFNNSYNSDINLNRSFPGKPYTAGIKMSLRQNAISKRMALTAPTFNFNVSRFFPFKVFKSSSNVKNTWYEKIAMSYNNEFQNRADFADSLLKRAYTSQIPGQFKNGFSQNTTIQTTLNIFKGILKFTPSANYSNKINFQGIERSFINDTLRTIPNSRTNINHEFSFNTQFTTALYAYFRFVGKRKTILRTVSNPTAGFSYRPAFANSIRQYTDLQGNKVKYAISEQSIYASSLTRNSASLTFGLNSSFELKQISKKDSTGFRKIRILDGVSVNGSYDYIADSLKLSDLSISARMSPITVLNIVYSSRYSLQNWNDATGAKVKEYALAERKKLGRFLSHDLSITYTLTSKESKQKMQDKGAVGSWNSDFQYFTANPYQMIDFDIPWKMNFSQIVSLNINQNRTPENNKSIIQTQTLAINADASFTKRWKVAVSTNFELLTRQVTNTRISLFRDMHCWQLAFYWTPIGTNQSFLLSFNATSNLLKDAKLDLRKPPSFF